VPDVVVWLADLDALQARDASSVLSSDELARAERFRFDVHRHRFVQCRSLLRRHLAETLGADAADITFRYGAHGKPEVDGVYFNVSHSENLAVIAVSIEEPVGIDIEHIDSSHDVLPLARTAFSRAECEAIAAMNRVEQIAAFYRTWAHKEAYLKLLGTGFSIPSDSFTASELDDCAIRDLDVHPKFACAIATAHAVNSIAFRT
jgi:4'-phosphopantetheinyl transferase